MSTPYTETTIVTLSTIKEEGEPYEEEEEPVKKRYSSATAETVLLFLSNCEFEDWETFEEDDDEEEGGVESYCIQEEPLPSSSSSSEEAEEPESLLDFIEVAPGLDLPLRGSEETMQAVKIDFLTSSSCLCCQQTLHCIQDADYVLCSDCCVVNRVEVNSSGGEYSSIGLGMNDKDLAECRAIVAATLELV
jgi:hypothetical protein